MDKTNAIKKSHSLKAKLFFFMLLLALILVFVFLVISNAFGSSLDYKKDLAKNLTFQAEILENNIIKHFEALEGHGARLVGSAKEIIDHNFNTTDIKIDKLNDDKEKIETIQESLFDILKGRLEKADCSGAFAFFDATVNSTIPNASNSKTGIYLQRSGYKNGDAEILLYRGMVEVSKKHLVMPHRKWSLEINVANFPSYDELISYKPNQDFTYITKAFMLPGMDEYAKLIVFPIYIQNKRIGYCGFEISESFFKTYHKMSSTLDQVISIFSLKENDNIIKDSGFSTGTVEGYYFNPEKNLKLEEGKILNKYIGLKKNYVGISKEIKIKDFEEDYLVSVLIPKGEYDLRITKKNVQISIIIILILFFAITFSYIFSRRFLKPLLMGLNQLKESIPKSKTNIPEINDLIEYLQKEEEKDNIKIKELENKHKVLLDKLKALQDNRTNLEEQLKQVQKELTTLKKDTINEDDTSFFLQGITILTPREKQVFDLYVKGYSAKEIREELNLTVNGLKYHNGNIYYKLGVENRKQLLLYISLLKKE